MELWPVICSIVGYYYNSTPKHSLYLVISWEPILWLQMAHSILLYLLLMEPLSQARAILGAGLLELWPFICSIICCYSNLPTNRIYLTISWEQRLCRQLAHSILLALLLMEPLNQARASLVAEILELWPVICSSIGLYDNSPTNSIYLAISWQPRLCQQLAHSILLSMLLMVPLNQARASLGAQCLELWPVICSIINLYYNSPKHRIYLVISWESRLCWKVAHSTLLYLLLMQPLNQARSILGAELLELWIFISSIINLNYYNSSTNRVYLTISWEQRLCRQFVHSILFSLLLMKPLNQARASLMAELLELWPFICSKEIDWVLKPSLWRRMS
jgi:hypothetical protein